LLKVEISSRTPIPLFRPGDIPQWHRQAETAVATTRLFSQQTYTNVQIQIQTMHTFKFYCQLTHLSFKSILCNERQ
jgi:hypothetical protein